RERWLALKQEEVPVHERLLDSERPGVPTKFTTEQVLKLFAIALDKIDNSRILLPFRQLFHDLISLPFS
ncbi:MAG: hypothetical protein AB4368_25675, partial [Xenococcaceae cyanobacterium]